MTSAVVNGASAIRAARGAVRSVILDLGPAGDPGAPLEITLNQSDPPRVVPATVVEDGTLRTHRVEGDPVAGFAAFLDGTQKSQPFDYVHGVPLVMGTVAAVVRERRDRRMGTWSAGPRLVRRVFAPRAVIGEALWSQLTAIGFDLATRRLKRAIRSIRIPSHCGRGNSCRTTVKPWSVNWPKSGYDSKSRGCCLWMAGCEAPTSSRGPAPLLAS